MSVPENAILSVDCTIYHISITHIVDDNDNDIYHVCKDHQIKREFREYKNALEYVIELLAKLV